MQEIDIVNLYIKHPTERKLLAVMRADSDAEFGGMWTLPGGKIESGENVAEASRRELREETDKQIKSLEEKPLLVSPLQIGDKIFFIGIFKAVVEGENFKPQDPDITKVEWIEPYVLLCSLIQHNFPKDQIDILNRFLSEVFS